MNVSVLYTEYERCILESLLSTYSHIIPTALLDKAYKFRRWQDGQAYLLGKLLIWKGFQKYNYKGNGLLAMQENSYSKPFIPGGVSFNISHSGKYVVGAFCKEAIGIDIEEMGPVEPEEFDYVFSEKEKILLKASEDPLKDFFRIWTLKESVIKADGRGLSLDLPSINVMGNEVVRVENDPWWVQELSLHQNYCCAIATKEKITELKVEKVVLLP